MKMQEKIAHLETESIIYKLVRNKDLDDKEKEIINKIIENKDYKN